MSKFVNKIDNRVFATKEDAVKYLEQNFLVQIDENESVESEIVSKIQTVVPDAEINVCAENCHWGKFKIVVKKDGVEIDQWLYAPDDDNYSTAFVTVEDLVNFYQWSFEKSLYIMERVKQRFSFKEFKFDRYHDDYGNGHFFDFTYETLQGDSGRKTYEPHMDLDTFVKEFSSHFLDFLEGNAEVRYDDGYFDDYYVDGVPIIGIINRAQKQNQKIRIAII